MSIIVHVTNMHIREEADKYRKYLMEETKSKLRPQDIKYSK